MKICPLQASDEPVLIQLIAEFRVSLGKLRGIDHKIDLVVASQELTEYLRKSYPIYVAKNETGALVGFLVCRVDGDVVWAESLHVATEYRRQGIGSALYAEAERLAQELGSETVYNWVDPNNDRIIHFLQKRGYNVLNLIELRRAYPGEETMERISVGANAFDWHNPLN